MVFKIFESGGKPKYLSEKILQVDKSKAIYLEDLFLYKFHIDNRSLYLISGQYSPTVFYNTVLLQKDDLIHDLEQNTIVKKVNKQIIKAEGLSAREGRLAFDDGSSLNWGKVMDLDLYLISIKLNHLNEPIELPFEVSNKPHKELEKVQEIADKNIPSKKSIIPLDPWTRNEKYWSQHYKLNYGKSNSATGCLKAALIVSAVLAVIFFLGALVS